MKMEPAHFTCKNADTGEWTPCSKEHICSNGLQDDEYQPVTTDYSYIENWQEQTHMLCESKQRIGFLGACFFIGVIFASTLVPVGYLSDILGRKWLFVGTLVVMITSLLGFLFATSLDQLYIFMFMFGATFPGRIIVGINYAYEFQTASMKAYVQPIG